MTEWKYPEPGKAFVPMGTGHVISMDYRQAREFFGLPVEENAPPMDVKLYVQIEPTGDVDTDTWESEGGRPAPEEGDD